MAITIEDALATQLALKENIPIELFEVYLETTPLRYTTYSDDLEFPTGSGTTYTSWGIRRGAIRKRLETGLENVEVSFDNVNRNFVARFVDNRYEFRKKQMKIIRVFGTLTSTNLLSDSIYATTIFDGEMDSPKVDQNWFTITVKSKLTFLNKVCPRRTFSPSCPWVFGDSNCDPYYGTDLAIKETHKGKIAEGGGTGLALYFSTKPSVTTLNYFRSGVIEMTDGKNENVKRIIESSSAWDDYRNFLTIRLYLSFPIIDYNMVGESFTLINNCDKTDSNCIDHNNIFNFGGFLYAVKSWVGKKLIVDYK